MLLPYHRGVKKLNVCVQGNIKLGALGEQCEAMKTGVVALARTSIFFHPWLKLFWFIETFSQVID